jgi:hypothetical protein
MNEQEKSWARVIAKALGCGSEGHISVTIEDREDGWVTVTALGTPAYKTPYLGAETLFDFTTHLARERLHTEAEQHKAAWEQEEIRRQKRLERLRKMSSTLAEVIADARELAGREQRE